MKKHGSTVTDELVPRRWKYLTSQQNSWSDNWGVVQCRISLVLHFLNSSHFMQPDVLLHDKTECNPFCPARRWLELRISRVFLVWTVFIYSSTPGFNFLLADFQRLEILLFHHVILRRNHSSSLASLLSESLPAAKSCSKGSTYSLMTIIMIVIYTYR